MKQLFRTTILLSAVVACSSPQRSAFRPSDGAFVPTPGDRPIIYTSTNMAELRNVSVRSVGIIEVTIRGGNSEQRAAAIAADEGQRLGCWAVVENAAFQALQSQYVTGTNIHLAHGGPHFAEHGAPRERVVKFHCVVRGPAAQRA